MAQLSSCQTSHVSLLNNQPHGEAVEVLMSMSRQVVAAFCALGGFRESVKVGSRVQVSINIFYLQLMLTFSSLVFAVSH